MLIIMINKYVFIISKNKYKWWHLFNLLNNFLKIPSSVLTLSISKQYFWKQIEKILKLLYHLTRDLIF